MQYVDVIVCAIHVMRYFGAVWIIITMCISDVLMVYRTTSTVSVRWEV